MRSAVTPKRILLPLCAVVGLTSVAFADSPSVVYSDGDHVSGYMRVTTTDPFYLLKPSHVPTTKLFLLTDFRAVARHTGKFRAVLSIGVSGNEPQQTVYRSTLASGVDLHMVSGFVFSTGLNPAVFILSMPRTDTLDVEWSGHFVPAASSQGQ